MGRYDLTDLQWKRLKPLLPPEKPRTGRPNHDHRRIATRHEKRAANYLAMITIAAILLWL